jgi:hypothetical protein
MKNVILVVRRGVYEVEWILPILILLRKKKYNIYTYFYNQKAFDSLANSPIIYKLWLNSLKSFYIKKKYSKFFLKIFRYLLIKLNIYKNLSKKLIEKIHDINKIKLNLGIPIDKNIECVLTDHQNYNPLINELYEKKIKIILFPPSPSIYVNNNLNNINKKNLLGKYLLVNDDISRVFFKKNFNIKYINIITTGVPQFENWYIKKIQENSIIKSNIIAKKSKRIVIAYAFKPTATDEAKLLCIEQLSSILELLTSYHNIEIVLKLHAFKQDNFYNSFFENIKKKDIKISENNIIYEMLNTDLLIASYKSSACVYGPLFKIPTITLWDPNFELNKKIYGKNYHDEYVKYGLSCISKSLKNLQAHIEKVISGTGKSKLWKKQIKNFNRIFFNSRLIPSKKIITLINGR